MSAAVHPRLLGIVLGLGVALGLGTAADAAAAWAPAAAPKLTRPPELVGLSAPASAYQPKGFGAGGQRTVTGH